MSRFRCTILQLISLVAIFGLVMGVALEAHRLLRRRDRFLALAEGPTSRRYDYGVGRYDLCFGEEYQPNVR